MPDAALGDAVVAGRIVFWQRPVRVVVGKVTAPYLLEHGDRRLSAHLLVPNVHRLVGSIRRIVAKYERCRRKDLELVGVSPRGGRTTFHVGVVALTVLE